MTPFPLGRRYKSDARDAAFPLRAVATSRRRRYWRDYDWMGNQQETSACVGFACAHYLSAAPFHQFVDPFGVYEMARYLDEWPGNKHDGTSVRAGVKVLSRLGFIQEYRWAKSLKVLTSHLLEKGPAILGLNWYEGMFEPGADGIITPVGRLSGGHAVCATYINLDKELIGGPQSWGDDWGLSGRWRMSLKDMARLIREDGEICAAIEKRNRGAKI